MGSRACLSISRSMRRACPATQSAVGSRTVRIEFAPTNTEVSRIVGEVFAVRSNAKRTRHNDRPAATTTGGSQIILGWRDFTERRLDPDNAPGIRPNAKYGGIRNEQGCSLATRAALFMRAATRRRSACPVSPNSALQRISASLVSGVEISLTPTPSMN